MRLSALLGMVLGLAAIVLAWTRAADREHAAARVAARSGAPASPTSPTRPPTTTAAIGSARAQSDLEALRARDLLIPVPGVEAKDLQESFADERSGHLHEALDIPAPRRTPVLAADDGFVAKLFTSVRGGLTVYQFDPTRTWCYYYAHLDGYAPGLHEGMTLHRGAVIGFVGTTGNAPPQVPHLHFAILRLGPDKRWWEGTAVDPYPVWASGS